jgi:DNA polymerase-3 subunit gamma/tau
VLARKYRPARFADLIGQEAAVRTLTNAIESGRMAQAFVLTGVRGVGKTTTARIIARALNCIGPDGTGGPTPEPCGVCGNCVAIAEDRHVDVLEMDAASRTGIDDIRELIEGVRYRPVQARRKVYIIDEVHMLSRQAFNGLLKTLEEPPEHVVFIFATTEARKIPVTVLSRCQRFDLRRLDRDELASHFARIAEAEGIAIDGEALAMIARAADGSVRDGLSLLDQAIALQGGHGEGEGSGAAVGAESVRAMLGLADRAQVFDLLEAVLRGHAPEALEILAALYESGADPAVVLQDLLEASHLVTRGKLVPETFEGAGVPETERVRGRALAEALSLPDLARAWQVLLKGLGEARAAPVPLQAAEMVLIRLAHASQLPNPAELVARLQNSAATPPSAAAPAPVPAPAAAATATSAPAPVAAPPAGKGGGGAPRAQAEMLAAGPAAAAPALLAEAPPELLAETQSEPAAGEPAAEGAQDPGLENFEAVVALVRAQRETILANHLERDLHLVHFEPGRIEFRPAEGAPRNLAGQLGALLQAATGARWMVSVSGEPGAPSLAEQSREREAKLDQAALGHPLVQAALEAFPGAKMVARRDSPGAAAPESDDPETSPETLEEGNEGP